MLPRDWCKLLIRVQRKRICMAIVANRCYLNAADSRCDISLTPQIVKSVTVTMINQNVFAFIITIQVIVFRYFIVKSPLLWLIMACRYSEATCLFLRELYMENPLCSHHDICSVMNGIAIRHVVTFTKQRS